MSKHQKTLVSNSSSKERLDMFVSQELSISRAQAQKLIKQGKVLVNEKQTKKHYQIKKNDSVQINRSYNKIGINDRVQTFAFNIIAQTNDYIIINKPSGVVVHPDSNHPQGTTLIDSIVKKFPEIKGVGEDSSRPGLVHRLDKPVSGVMIIARTQSMFDHLKKQFHDNQTTKQYIALVHGIIEEDDIAIDYSLERKPTGFMAAITDKHSGRKALTRIKVTKRYKTSTLAHVFPKTGRTHQIRVHLFAYGHPIVGEEIYMSKKYKPSKLNQLLGRPFLHAHKLDFLDLNNERKEYTSQLPLELSTTLSPMSLRD